MSISMKSLLESVITPKQTEDVTPSTQLDESVGRVTNADVETYVRIYNIIINGHDENIKVEGHRITRRGLYFIWSDYDGYNITRIDKNGSLGSMPVEMDILDLDEATRMLSSIR